LQFIVWRSRIKQIFNWILLFLYLLIFLIILIDLLITYLILINKFALIDHLNLFQWGSFFEIFMCSLGEIMVILQWQGIYTIVSNIISMIGIGIIINRFYTIRLRHNRIWYFISLANITLLLLLLFFRNKWLTSRGIILLTYQLRVTLRILIIVIEVYRRIHLM
jgi:hypothetical protein